MLKTIRTQRKEQQMALERAIARAKVDLHLPYDKDVAERLDLSPQQYARRKPDLYKGFGFEDVANLARKLELTPAEVLEALGMKGRAGV